MASLLSTLLGSAGARKPDAAERSDVGAPSPGYTPAPGREAFTVGGGCFWSVQLAYDREPGVTKTVVGYSQGHTPSPTYEDTCTGRTGHTEVVLVEYDPKARRALGGAWRLGGLQGLPAFRR